MKTLVLFTAIALVMGVAVPVAAYEPEDVGPAPPAELLIDNGETVVLDADLSIPCIRVVNGVLATVGHRVTADYIFIGAGYDSENVVVVDFGKSEVDAPWFCVYYGQPNLVVLAEEATIRAAHFFGGNQAYGAVLFQGGESYTLTDDNSFKSLGVTEKTLWLRGHSAVDTLGIADGVTLRDAKTAEVKEPVVTATPGVKPVGDGASISTSTRRTDIGKVLP